MCGDVYGARFATEAFWFLCAYTAPEFAQRLGGQLDSLMLYIPFFLQQHEL
jgi:hypothetical protein